jgi:hypothetical protein
VWVWLLWAWDVVVAVAGIIDEGAAGEVESNRAWASEWCVECRLEASIFVVADWICFSRRIQVMYLLL